MKNFALEWKDYIKLKEIPYKDFASTLFSHGRAYCLEKVDGMLGALVYIRNQEIYFQTTTGGIISDIPVLQEYKLYIDKLNGIDHLVLIGELVAMKNLMILPFNEIMSIVKTPHISNHASLINHFLFDVLYINDKRITNYHAAVLFLHSYFDDRRLERVHIPKYKYGDLEDFQVLYNDVLKKDGYDGIVVRELNGKNYKVKPQQTFDLAVIGAGNTEMPAWKKEQVSFLITAFVDKDGMFRVSSKIGTGFTSKVRSELYQYVLKNRISESNKGNFLIKPELVIEVQCLRYQFKEMPCFKYDGIKFIDFDNKLSCTLSIPKFIRIREDKKVGSIETGLAQIPGFLNK